MVLITLGLSTALTLALLTVIHPVLVWVNLGIFGLLVLGFVGYRENVKSKDEDVMKAIQIQNEWW